MASTSITKRGEVWQYQIKYFVDGKRKSVAKSGFKTKREAKEAAVLKESELHSGVDVVGNKALLSDFMQQWKELYKDGTITERGAVRIDWIIRFVKREYNMPLRDITLDNYQRFLNSLADKYAKESVKKIHTYIKASLTHAVRTGLLARNPVEGAIVRGNKKKEKTTKDKFISQEQFLQLESALMEGLQPSYTSRYLILFGMFTGARIGECLGLTWDCVDLENGKVRIEKGWDYQITNTYTDGKTASSKRTITIPNKLVELLKTLPHEGERVFKTVTPDAANKTLRKFLKRIDPDSSMTFHGLRHTHASILISQGVNILSVSKRLGHADISETLKTYAHVIEELENRDSDKIKGIFE